VTGVPVVGKGGNLSDTGLLQRALLEICRAGLAVIKWAVYYCLYMSIQVKNNPWDHLWLNARIATLQQGNGAYGLLDEGAIATRGDRIVWLGSMQELDTDQRQDCADVLDCQGRLVTPGLIDCHTHLVYAGDRSHEFEMRLAGASYTAISRAGGGINATVSATRAASEDELLAQSLPRLQAFLAEGVTTIEIKSGYGLELATERKMLQVARHLGEMAPITVRTSFLGGHALPPEYADDPDGYIAGICQHMLPAVADLSDAVDGFCEGIAFSVSQIERVFQTARDYGLPVKLHAEQLSLLGGAALVARYGGLSADHLEYLDAAGARAMAEAGTVAVLLPGAYYFLRETQPPPLSMLRDLGVPIAIASDSNPGSSPVQSLLLMMNMACTLFGMTPEEALAGVTREAARALGLEQQIGTLAPGKRADLVLWDVTDPAALSYNIGHRPCRQVLYGGQMRVSA